MSKYPDIIQIDLRYMQSVVLVFNRARNAYGRAVSANFENSSAIMEGVKDDFCRLGLEPALISTGGYKIVRFKPEDNDHLIKLANTP